MNKCKCSFVIIYPACILSIVQQMPLYPWCFITSLQFTAGSRAASWVMTRW